MTDYQYPLLYWPLSGPQQSAQQPENASSYCGLLVGPGYQTTAASLKKLQAEFAAQLQRDYKEYDWLPADLPNARLKTVPVAVRPSYKQGEKRYPLPRRLQLPVLAVYAEEEDGYAQCYLPQLDMDFYYHDDQPLDNLIRHFTEEHFADASPEQLHPLLHRPDVQLAEVRYRSSEPKRKKRPQRKTVDFDTLPTVADRYPSATAQPLQSDAAWERETLLSQVLGHLRQQRSILLLGPPASGKSTILIDAIRQLHQQDRRLWAWRSSGKRLQGSARYLGDWQENLEEALDELESHKQLLWVENLVELTAAGGEGPEDSVAAYLLPRLATGELRIVAETTAAELETLYRRLPALLECFEIVRVPELSTQQVLNIGRQFAQRTANNFNVGFSEVAVEQAYRLLQRYQKSLAFPGKLVRFMVQLANDRQQSGIHQCEQQDVLKQFVQLSGLPEFLLKDELALDLDSARRYFSQRLMGQDQVIDHLVDIVTLFKAGLNNPDKPIATLLFAGPTGVGKTASAQALASYFFSHGAGQDPLVRLDMSEFQHPAQLGRLIGDAQTPGKLIQAVRERPFTVLLLDEIEKAHAGLFDSLLNVLDEGVLLDAMGRPTDFRNTILIMTSNLGASDKRAIGFTGAAPDYAASVKQFFRPEFYNRIDKLVPFNSLDQVSIERIAAKELKAVNERDGIKQRQLKLHYSDRLLKHIAAIGFHPAYGARPLQRCVEQQVIAPLGQYLLEAAQLNNTSLFLDWDQQLRITRR